jgi:hypothetical protein
MSAAVLNNCLIVLLILSFLISARTDFHIISKSHPQQNTVCSGSVHNML